MTITDLQCVQGVVFDLDGLMINTECIFNSAGQELLRRRGETWTVEIQNMMMGRPAADGYSLLIDKLQLNDTPMQLADEAHEVFDELLDDNLKAMPGLFQLLDQIESRKIPKGVATSSRRNYLEQMLHRFDLTDRFVFTLTADDVEHGKPNPEVYLKAARCLGIDPSRMMVLEDSEAGTRAAAGAGAIAVAVPHEHSQHQDFSAATAVAVGLHDSLIIRLIDEQRG